jgi:cyclohexanone monooxygenase
MRAKHRSTIEADDGAQEDWVEHVRTIAAGTLFPTAKSWYMGANIPGKPRVFLPFIGGLGTYTQTCDDVARDGYRGFTLA